MIRRTIGDSPPLNAIGLGCMGMAAFYGQPMEEDGRGQSASLGRRSRCRSFRHGRDVWHGPKRTASLVQRFTIRREKVFIATKFGPKYNLADWRATRRWIGRRTPSARLNSRCSFLKTDHVDLWYLHRRDFSRPIEETVGAMAEAVKEGKVRNIGLSEVTAETLRAAHKVHPIAALQSEFSIFTRFVETRRHSRCLQGTRHDAGGVFTAWTRGMLAGWSKDWKADGFDFRAYDGAPLLRRCAGEQSQALVEEIAKRRHGVSTQPPDRWRSPGCCNGPTTSWRSPAPQSSPTSSRTLALPNVKLTPAAIAQASTALAAKVKGERYDEAGLKGVNG
jgi:hypothetical protein